jgi:hypothetical protein
MRMIKTVNRRIKKKNPLKEDMPISIDTLRVGHRYTLINYGEITDFELLRIENKEDYIIRDLNSLETFNLRVLIEYGKGRDYDLYEMEEE